MARLGMSTITLYEPGWGDPRPLAVADLVVTAAVEQPGNLSCFAPAAALARLGFDDWIGRWWLYRHATQGVFAGVLDDEPGTVDDQTVELAGVDMRGLLMGRRLPVLYRVDTAHAGALARRALSDPTTVDPLPITHILADEVGRPLEAEWRGDDTYDMLAALANQSGQEWDVVVDDALAITLLWQERLGQDKRDTVLIREGAHVASGRIDRSRVTIVNDIAGVAADESYERSSYHQSERADSIARYGRRQSPIRRYEGVVTESTIRAKVRADLDREANGVYLPTITLPAMHPICHEIRHGDTIRYWSAVKNRELDVRVMSRTVRTETILELAGEATEVRVPPRARPFTPDKLSGLVAWYDADDTATVTVLDGRVWRWADKSGNGHDLTASGGFGTGQAPAYLPNALNGRAVIDMGEQDGLDVAAVDLSGTSAVTVYVVVLQTVDGGALPWLAFGDVSSDAGTWHLTRDDDDHPIAALRGNVGLADVEAAGTLGTTDWHALTAIFDLSQSTNEASLWFDGVAASTRTNNSNNAGAFGSAGLTLNPVDLAVHSTYRFAEIIIFDRVHGTTHRSAVEGYMAQKWGVPA